MILRWCANRNLRVILFAVCFLALADTQVVPSLNRLEVARYEADAFVRFEASDMFVLAPIASYLREHPVGSRPRVAFFGNSLVWGYRQSSSETVSAEFQRLVPQVKVFNFGVNGFETGSIYLTTKAIIDSLDVICMFHNGTKVHPLLANAIPISQEDARRFGLSSKDPIEQSMEELLGVWKLYRYSYRLQASLLGTSTRRFVIEQLKDVMSYNGVDGGGVERKKTDEVQPFVTNNSSGVKVETSQSPFLPSADRMHELKEKHSLLWDYAKLIKERRKQGLIVEFYTTPPLDSVDLSDLNAVFAPNVRFIRLHVGRNLLQRDEVHFTHDGARAVARAILEVFGKERFSLRDA